MGSVYRRVCGADFVEGFEEADFGEICPRWLSVGVVAWTGAVGVFTRDILCPR